MVFLLNELLQSFSSRIIGGHRSFLDVYTDMAFFLLDEYIQPFDDPASCLHTALKQFLYIGCIKMAVLWQSTTDRQIEWKAEDFPTSH